MSALIRKFKPLVLPFIVFSVLWLLLIKNLSLYWGADPQYSFGWFGPLLCAYLFLNRWLSRSPAEPASSVAAKWAFWIAAAAFLPTWVVEQPNPDWRGLSWALTLEVVLLTLSAIYFVGGKSWLRHFAFSICFILTTLPWPGGVETFLIQGLMHVVAWVTVGLLNLSRIAAVQHGNLIEVKTGLLGIDEACCGIRSLQASVMVAFLLGELYRATFRRRTLFLLAGILIAFSCNVGRTFFLSWTAASQGIDSVPKWHDWAGIIELAICFFALWTFVHLMGRSSLKQHPSAQAFSNIDRAPRPFPQKMAISLGLWLALTLIGTETWYRAHENGQLLQWSFQFPASKPKFKTLSLPDLLGDEQRAASWTENDGSRWTALFFKWAAGPPRSRILARLHRPENCLPAAGYKLQTDRGIITVRAKDLKIPFHAMDFEYDGRQAYVFFCVWQDGLKSGQQLRWRDHWDDRLVGLESVLLGERNLAQQTLEIVVFGYSTSQEAENALRRQMEELIQI
ncbi:MAG TPA: exosortase/archaeosortase family protein [Chthoniobacterales bacterium]